jgi:hypothetical protein
MGMGKMTGKFRHGGKIPAVEIGTRLEKIPIWWEIALRGKTKRLPVHGNLSAAASII